MYTFYVLCALYIDGYMSDAAIRERRPTFSLECVCVSMLKKCFTYVMNRYVVLRVCKFFCLPNRFDVKSCEKL